MYDDKQRKYLENIVQANVIEGRNDIATSIRNHLCKSYSASNVAERKFEYFQQLKKEQANIIAEIITNNSWWCDDFLKDYQYLTEGGEAKVYLSNCCTKVLKINDAVYYNTWLDFFNSILLHNFYFQNTSYCLIGFITENDTLFAVVEQPYIIANKITDIDSIKTYLGANNFEHKKRYDYFNKTLGISLEDMHDENVLTFNDTLFFIDTFFSL